MRRLRPQDWNHISRRRKSKPARPCVGARLAPAPRLQLGFIDQALKMGEASLINDLRTRKAALTAIGHEIAGAILPELPVKLEQRRPSDGRGWAVNKI